MRLVAVTQGQLPVIRAGNLGHVTPLLSRLDPRNKPRSASFNVTLIVRRPRSVVKARPAVKGLPVHLTAEEARVCCCLANSVAIIPTSSILNVATVMSNIRNALDWRELESTEHMEASGVQVAMELEGTWRMLWASDGSFYEEWHSSDLSYQWGFDGRGGVWAADTSGRVTKLDLDDYEVCLLSSWVRTGFWLSGQSQRWLQCRLAEPHEVASLRPPGNSSGAASPIVVHLSLVGGLVAAYVVVDEDSWLPTCVHINAYGSYERWDLSRHSSLSDKCCIKVAAEVHRYPTAGGVQDITVHALQVSPEEPTWEDADGGGSIYSMPDVRYVSRPNTCPTFSFSSPSASVKVKTAASGHLLVRPLVNGMDVGYFVLDTGATGFTLVPSVARKLGLRQFGTVCVVAAQGPMKCCFCQADSFQLGPLLVSSPVFVEVDMAGIVRGAGGPVAGLCGSDVFFSCTIEMPNAGDTIVMHNADTYRAAADVLWESLRFMAGVPQIAARVQMVENAQVYEVLLLLDTGAQGAQLILHSRFLARSSLDNPSSSTTSPALAKGVGDSGTTLEVQYGLMARMDLAGHFVAPVTAIFAPPGVAAFDISQHTAGILCGDILQNFDLVFDHSRSRIALLSPES
eukprot:jgi/Mesen1/6594/ME000338S05777